MTGSRIDSTRIATSGIPSAAAAAAAASPPVQPLLYRRSIAVLQYHTASAVCAAAGCSKP